MKVLIACEFSGIVRDEFRKRGHDAYSCDLLECERDGRYHIQGNVFNYLNWAWDLLIFHWPCTRICNSGVRWLFGGKGQVRDDQRWKLMEQDATRFRSLLQYPIEKVAGENPIPHRYAAEIISQPYSQIIHPYQFGHMEQKSTCLWLKNLPLLIPTNNVKEAMMKLPKRERESPLCLSGEGPLERAQSHV